MVTLSIAAIVMAVGVLGIRRDFLDLSTSSQGLRNDLKQARMDATRRGVHYRVTLSPGSYRTEWLTDPQGDGSWEVAPSTSPQLVDLPDDVSLATEGSGTVVEFNSRGLVVGADGEPVGGVVEIILTDQKDGTQRRIHVWPSGQIRAEQTAGGPTS
jgi:hypothetical protein